MSQLRKHDPILQQRLAKFLNAADAEGLSQFLEGLTVAQFRTAGYLLSSPGGLETLSSDDYWRFFLVIVPRNSKAYLGTFLKAAVQKTGDGSLELHIPTLQSFSSTATPIDRRKLLAALLPLQSSPDDINSLLQAMDQLQLEAHIALLTPVETVASYYALFKSLKLHDATPQQLRRICIMLMRQQRPLPFRFAAVLKAYFDIKDLPGTFSLKILPWQLGRLDASYDNFRKLMQPA